MLEPRASVQNSSVGSSNKSRVQPSFLLWMKARAAVDQRSFQWRKHWWRLEYSVTQSLFLEAVGSTPRGCARKMQRLAGAAFVFFTRLHVWIAGSKIVCMLAA